MEAVEASTVRALEVVVEAEADSSSQHLPERIGSRSGVLHRCS